MNYMPNTRKKRRQKNNKIIIGIVIAISLIISIYLLSIIEIPMLSNISSKMVSTVDSILSSVGGVITQGTSYFGNTKQLNNKVKELEKQLEQASITIQQYKTVEVENKDLKELLKINEEYNHFEKIYANVINRAYANWNDTFVIDKGKKDGVKQNQTVICKTGLVGYVSSVSNDTSVVTTILDTSSAISVEIANVNALALAKGNFALKEKGQVKLVNIPIDMELTVGENIYTSGIGGLYKKGIPIGVVSEVFSNKNDIDRYAYVDVFADVESIDLVGVIVK